MQTDEFCEKNLVDCTVHETAMYNQIRDFCICNIMVRTTYRYQWILDLHEAAHNKSSASTQNKQKS